MSTLSLVAQADTIQDTPVQSGLITLLNALLAPLLSDKIIGVAFKARNQQSTLQLFGAAMTYQPGSSTTMANPYQVQMFTGRTIVEVTSNAQAFFTTNPGYFYSPLFIQQFSDINRRNMPWIGLVVYNIVYSDGLANWGLNGGGGGGGGPPTGPAGGDLSGTYPNPIVGPITTGEVTATLSSGANVLQTYAAGVIDALMEVNLTKGSNSYSTSLRMNLNGTNAGLQEYGVAINPDSGGTFDFTFAASVVGGQLTLTCTTSSTGWTSKIRSRTFS